MIWKIDSNGNETIIHNFGSSQNSDVAQSYAKLVSSGTALYGTGNYGGSSANQGGVFKLTQDQQGNWTFSIVYGFQGKTGDGSFPRSPVVFWNDAIYGLTSEGGNSSNCGNGCGIIYKIVE